MEQSIFEQAICDVDGLRTIYYALDALSPDDPQADVWRLALSDALREFTNRLSQAITAPPPDLGDDFICAAMRLAVLGADRASLNAEFGLDIFLPAPARERYDPPDLLYFYEFNDESALMGLMGRSAEEVYAAFVADILDSTAVVQHSSALLFDRKVCRKYFAVLYALRGREHYPDAGPGSGPPGGTRVPRAPYPPRRSGGAGEEIPHNWEHIEVGTRPVSGNTMGATVDSAPPNSGER